MSDKRTGNILTGLIILCMVAGVALGHIINVNMDKAEAAKYASFFSVISIIFLRMIKMIIAPLVFTTLVVGVAHMGDGKTIGRVGLKAMLWFVMASIISISLGILMANLLQPGAGLNMTLPSADAVGTTGTLPAGGIQTSSFTAEKFFTNLVPTSLIKAMADNEILQIVIFSLFFGVSLAALKETGKPLIRILDIFAQAMLKFTGLVMWGAPVAVFAAMASTIIKQGLGVISALARFIGTFYIGLGILWLILIAAGFFFVGKSLWRLLKEVREPFLLSFATASSEAAFPKLLTALDRFGVRRRISSFVLPLGYSFNLDGSMIYCAFAILFITQAYNIHMDAATQVTMGLVLMLTSKGMAGVPRASLVVVAATLGQFQIPEAGLLLVMGVDQFLDMGRSATNSVGNSIAAAAVAKWEGELLSPEALAEEEAANQREALTEVVIVTT